MSTAFGFSSLFLLAALLASLCSEVVAIPWRGPTQTPTSEPFPSTEWTPRPTLPPEIAFLKNKRLRRQEYPTPLTSVFYTNEYNLCGFVSGVSTDILTCDDDGYTCFMSPAISAHGCCLNSLAAPSDCRMHTRCVNESEQCTGTCIKDPLVKKCHNPVPYCATWHFWNGYTSYECDTVSFEAPVSRPGIDIRIKPEYTTTTDMESGTATATVVPEKDETSTPIAAIIGGAVGGAIFLIILCAIAIIWYRRRRGSAGRSSRRGSSTAATSYPVTEVYAPKKVTELDSSPKATTPGPKDPVEMDSPPGQEGMVETSRGMRWEIEAGEMCERRRAMEKGTPVSGAGMGSAGQEGTFGPLGDAGGERTEEGMWDQETVDSFGGASSSRRQSTIPQGDFSGFRFM